MFHMRGHGVPLSLFANVMKTLLISVQHYLSLTIKHLFSAEWHICFQAVKKTIQKNAVSLVMVYLHSEK